MTRLQSVSGPVWLAAVACVILLINLSFLLTVHFATHDKGPDGYPALRPPTCEAASRWSSGLHFVINVLSSALLAASNYYMQRLSGCTRAEIDDAHRKGKWVEIGVPGLRNLRFMSWDRVLMWIILAASSLPIHLL